MYKEIVGRIWTIFSDSLSDKTLVAQVVTSLHTYCTFMVFCCVNLKLLYQQIYHTLAASLNSRTKDEYNIANILCVFVVN